MDEDLAVGTVPLEALKLLEPLGDFSVLLLPLLRRKSLKKGIIAYCLPLSPSRNILEPVCSYRLTLWADSSAIRKLCCRVHEGLSRWAMNVG